MAKTVAKTKVVAVEPAGCATCNNTGLDSPGVGAQACPDCNGSPYGEGSAPEVQVDIAPIEAPEAKPQEEPETKKDELETQE